MSLPPGTRLGPYEIGTPLGAGGMGEVYRARDTRLDRMVAVKILPAQFSADPVRKQRFEREARIISSLNHPHICVLHDVGYQDGIDYLVMECVEGETLSKRLEKGALPIEQVLKFSMQISDALDKAHRSGIIHRDLKPGNIMLTPTGAKLLDFGLAKPAAPLASLATLTLTAPKQSPATEQGTIVGTFQYMSPEQIEGKELDGRSDIFSLGAVLYEMLTGQRAFPGKSQLSVASAILEKEPAPISKIKPMTPPALDHTIRRCLAKDQDERWQTARDVMLELKWIAEARSQVGAPTADISPPKLRERLAWLAAVALAIVAILTAAGWWRASRTPPEHLPMRLNAELTPGTRINRFRGSQLALSPDGTRIVVAEQSKPTGDWHLAMRRLDQGKFEALSGTDHAVMPFFSPDGQWIAFFADGKLKKMTVQGGAPVTLCDAPGPRGGSWGDDDNIVVAFDGGLSGLRRVPSAGGAPTQLTKPSKEKGEMAHAWPQVLPGSQAVLFTSYVSGAYDDAEIDVFSFKNGEQKTLHRGGYFGRYVSGGHLLFLHQDTLWVAPLDLSRLTVATDLQPALEEVNSNVNGGGDFDLSRTGTLVYVSSNVQSSFPYSIWWLDSTGQTKPLQVTPGMYENPHFSPDGKRLAFELAISPSRADIWVKDLERGTTSRVTHLPGRNNAPLWTPDGRGIVFSSTRQAAPGIYWIRADGAGEAQRLTDAKTLQLQSPRAFSPDGRRLAYVQFGGDIHWEIWTAPMVGDRDHPQLGKAEPFLRTSFSETQPAFSPDGRWLAYSSNESGNFELYVRPFPGPGGKWQISTGGGMYPTWSHDGRRLFFLSTDWHIMVAGYTVKEGSFAAGKPQAWSQKNLIYLGGNYPYDLAPDGKRFAVVLNAGGATEQEEKSVDSVTVLLNFFDGLRRDIPTVKN
jgi:serine/threonine protein kinase/Tol biopolymer transport system component